VNITNALVVEDNARARQWLSECLHDAFPGVIVTAVGTLAQARGALRSQLSRARAHGKAAAFDLALIDIGLPDGSGIDLIAELSSCDDRCAPVVTTIYDDPMLIFEAISAGARGYLLKYHETDRLIALLKRILDDEPPLSPAVARHVMAALKAMNPKIMSDDASLTAREEEVLSLLGRGFQLNSVARTLDISPNTASTHVKSIYRKLNIRTRAEAALAARDRGLLRRGS
jgi:DNA-binding NarL/FixJ family response regulator